MTQRQHWAIFINNQSNKQGFIQELLVNSQPPKGFEGLKGLSGVLFSKLALDKFIEEEERHDLKLITANTTQSLKSMSSGERKKALLSYLLKTDPDFLIMDNPLDNLDVSSQQELKSIIQDLSSKITIIQLISRASDLLPFINNFGRLENDTLGLYKNLKEARIVPKKISFSKTIPSALKSNQEAGNYGKDYLVRLKNVSVNYGDKSILNHINWDIRPQEFWQLAGKNGSGKSTLLSMITGDNPKGFGEDLNIFGYQKGSGESIWDLKKNIGYFTPAMVDRFRGYHSLENMLISGLLDSIGLYIKPTEAQLRLASEWLELLGMEAQKHSYFHELSMGQQRLIMCVRAMIKHPLLLILDEPTAGLDDQSAALVVALVNKMAEESTTSILFVSHRDEPGLLPNFVYQLKMTQDGSVGNVQ